jgi:hypothetical protein
MVRTEEENQRCFFYPLSLFIVVDDWLEFFFVLLIFLVILERIKPSI